MKASLKKMKAKLDSNQEKLRPAKKRGKKK
jgi:hypothetical protein